MTVKAKRFRIGVEGATTDGREIQREWLEQMAASYNPAVYTALINLEHIKSYLPDSTFNRYGKVTALFAEEIKEGPLAGKMALYADVEPTESLVELVKKGQKLFTSMEVSPKFADTGKAYLVGLAATDDPASLGTEMLTFSASAAHNPLANRKQNPANLFTAAEETVIELEEVQDDKPSLFARVTALFTKKEQSDDARFSDVHKAVELVATEQQNLSARTEKSLSEQEERLSELETALQAQLGGVADRLDYRKAAALGSTFLTLGAAPEVAASAANAMVRELSIATMQSKSFFEGMNLLKLNPEVIEKQMTKDAMGTIQRVLEKVNALPQDKRLSAMTMLFGKEFGDDAAKLANNLSELQRQLKLTAGNDALGSMQKESDINKDSLSAQWLLVKTGAQNTFSSLGETLRQPLMDILYTVKSVTGALRRWVEANPELTGTLMKASAVVAAVTVGLGTLAVALAAVLGPLAVIRLGFSVLGIKTLSSVTAAVTRTSSALSWLAGAPLALLRRGLASSGNAAGLLTAPLSSLRRTASLTGNVLKTVAGAPVALLRSGLSGLRAVAVMFMNPLAVLRGGLAAAGAVLRVLASGPLAMLRVALYAISGLLGALLSPIGLVVTALAGVALVVWKYWQPITAFLGGVVEGFKAAAGPISAAFEPLKPVFQWIGDKVQALWGWFTDLLTPVKSTSAELQSAAAMGRRFGEALAEGLNMVMHPLDSLKSGVSWLLEKLGIVSKEAAKAKLPESVTRQQPATVNADGKVMMPSGGFPSWGYGFAGMYDSGGYIPRGQFGIVGENGPEIVNGPANVTSRRNTAALAAVVAGMMGVAAAPAELPPLHPLALPTKGGEAIVSRAATVPLVQRIEAPTQIIIQTQPGQSAQDIAREVARQLDERERRLKAKARSNYSDQGGYDA
ncbi:phage tail tape measure protein [Escherichia coli]|nr:phage tail tape measure protein [Escherichia coli]NJZ42918.1 phage tail tape measure protein [Escherichia coli]OSC04373.1 phage tail tape measure protein [Escherichia coli]HAW9432416.1 phage tail tape measure protein [Escherichia coli]HAX2388150.1 phage tail tape measure protein [Escherichia coli]